jgi:hypothetical protein
MTRDANGRWYPVAIPMAARGDICPCDACSEMRIAYATGTLRTLEQNPSVEALSQHLFRWYESADRAGNAGLLHGQLYNGRADGGVAFWRLMADQMVQFRSNPAC